MQAEIVEASAVEVCEHRFVGRVLHRPVVLRGAPQVRFGPVAAGAGFAADEESDGGARYLPGFFVTLEQSKSKATGDHDHRGNRCRDPGFALGTGNVDSSAG